MAVDKEDVTFYLFNSDTDEKGHNLRRTTLNSKRMNANFPVKILIHGWMDDYSSYWYKPTIEEYLKRGNVNVVTVSWGKHAKNLVYPSVVKAVRTVGQHVGDMITEISTMYDVPIPNFHLIGHSLGAHISGFAGKTIFNQRALKVGRITGLDPAWPSFEKSRSEDRLCSNDADFVDIIHTDGGGAGCPISIGHIDFYPNGGVKRQNGCAAFDLGCSHKRAPIYFYESINSNNFVAVEASNFTEFESGRCNNNNRAIMGENVDKSHRGNFYLHTNKKSPFAKGPI